MAAASALPLISSLTSIGVASCGSSDRAVFSPITDWVAIAIGTIAGIRRKYARKFRTMNPCAASFGVQARELLEVLLDLAELVRIELVDLDECDDRGRDGGEDQRREDDGPQEEAVREEVTRLLHQDGPDVSGSHQLLPRSI